MAAHVVNRGNDGATTFNRALIPRLLLVQRQDEGGLPALLGLNSHSAEFLNSRTSWHTWHTPELTGPLGGSITQWC